jgi:acyl carrier protein
MNDAAIHETLLPIIEKYLPEDVDTEDITPDKDLIKDLKINSAYLIDIIIAIEETFELKVEDHEIPQINTVQEAIDLIKLKTSKNT